MPAARWWRGSRTAPVWPLAGFTVSLHRRLLSCFVLSAVCALAPGSSALAISGGRAVTDVLSDSSSPAALRRLAGDVGRVTVAVQWLDVEGRNQGLCTGTLVHPEVVLTAAHCVVAAAERPTAIRIGFTADLVAGERDRSVWRQSIDVAIHPRFSQRLRAAGGGRVTAEGVRAVLARRGEFSGFDVALVLLHRAAPDSHRPARMVGPGYRDSARAVRILAGFGQTDGYRPESAGRLVFAETGTTPERSGPPSGEARALESSRRRGGAITPCRGDSGGPVFVRSPDGTITLIGVTSAGDDHCRELSLFTPLDDVRSELRALFRSLTAGSGAESGNPF